MRYTYLILLIIVILLNPALSLNLDTKFSGAGEVYSWTDSNCDQYKETLNGTGIHSYSRNISTDDDISAVRLNYIYTDEISPGAKKSNSSYHYVGANSAIGLRQSVSTFSNKTTIFQANISSEWLGLSTNYDIQTEWGNITEGISYNQNEGQITGGQKFKSKTELIGNYSFSSALNEKRIDLSQKDDASDLRYKLDAITLTGESPIKEVRIPKRPIRIVNTVALSPKESSKIYYSEALKLVKSAREETDEVTRNMLYNRALENISEAVGDDPNDFDSYVEMGYILYMLNRSDESIEAYDNALKIKETAAVYKSKAKIQAEKLKDYLGASASYKKATELNPGEYITWSNLAANLIETGDYEGAVSACDHSLGINDRYQSAWYLKGLAQYYLHQDDKARTALEHAIELGSNTPAGIDAKATLDMLDQPNYFVPA